MTHQESVNKSNLGEFFAGIENLKNGRASDDRFKNRRKQFNRPNVWVFTNNIPDINYLSKDRWEFWKIENNNLVNITKEIIPDSEEMKYKKIEAGKDLHPVEKTVNDLLREFEEYKAKVLKEMDERREKERKAEVNELKKKIFEPKKKELEKTIKLIKKNFKYMEPSSSTENQPNVGFIDNEIKEEPKDNIGDITLEELQDFMDHL